VDWLLGTCIYTIGISSWWINSFSSEVSFMVCTFLSLRPTFVWNWHHPYISLTVTVYIVYLFFSFWTGLGFELRTSCLQSTWATPPVYFCSGFFWRWGLSNCLPRVALNHSSPDFNLPGDWDYRCNSRDLAPFYFLKSKLYLLILII
jgi:hypothetical protein